MSKCKCFSEMIDKVRPQIMEAIPKGSVDIDISWQGMVFFPSGGDYAPVNPRVEVEYRKPKNGGGHAVRFTKDSVSILCNYCPFCGRKLMKNKEEGPTDE